MMKWMAADNSFNGHQAAVQNAVFFYRFIGIS
jgi:hypothetical protein